MQKKALDRFTNSKFLLLILLFVSLFALVSYTVSSHNDRNVEGIFVNIDPLINNSFLVNEEDVRDIIDTKYRFDLADLDIHQVDLGKVEDILEAEPIIKTADSYMDASGILKVNVVQRQPIARIIDETGKTYYIDEEGIRIPTSRHSSARVLLVNGTIPSFPSDKERYSDWQNNLVTLLQHINTNDFSRKMIEQIHFSKKDNGWVIPKLGKQQFYFGDLSRVEEKIEALELTYKEIFPKKGWNTYSKINLSFKDQIVCK